MRGGAARRSDNLRRVNGSFEDKTGTGEGGPRSMRMRRPRGDQLNEVQRRDIAALFGEDLLAGYDEFANVHG